MRNSYRSSNSQLLFVLAGLLVLVVGQNLSGGKAQGLMDVSCPTRSAIGRIEAGQVQVIFHEPKGRRDIQIDYDGDNWDSQTGQLAGLAEQGFNASNPTVVYLHAYTQNANRDWLLEVRHQYDANYTGQFNLLLLDWSYFSRQRYDHSASWTPRLGRLLGDFLLRLQQATDDSATMMGRTHLVSYSLSTHIAGLAGRHIKSVTSKQDGGRQQAIGRITALDPTGVCFHQKGSEFARQYALKPTDAQLVVARHFDMGTLGAGRPIGDVDVFVNGGKNQPTPTRGSGRFAFWAMARSVGLRAPSHMLASLNEMQQEQVAECRNVAYACANYETFLSGECADCGRRNSKCMDMNTMTASAAMQSSDATDAKQHKQYKAGTSMFMKTSQDSTCIHHYQAILRLKSEPSRAERKLLEESVSFAFIGVQPNQRAKIDHRPIGQRRSYTALLTTENGRLADTNRIQMQLSNNNNNQQEEKLVQLANNIDELELNYMSHVEASVREKKSAKFCISSKSNGILRKC